MQGKDQNLVAKDLSLLCSKTIDAPNNNVTIFTNKIISFLDILRETRNVVAHDNNLLNYEPSINTPYIKQILSIYNINSNDSRKDVYNIMIIMNCFLTKSQQGQFNNIILKRLRSLSNKIVIIKII